MKASEVMSKVIELLEPLSDNDRNRVLMAVLEFMKEEKPKITINHPRPNPTLRYGAPF